MYIKYIYVYECICEWFDIGNIKSILEKGIILFVCFNSDGEYIVCIFFVW